MLVAYSFIIKYEYTLLSLFFLLMIIFITACFSDDFSI